MPKRLAASLPRSSPPSSKKLRSSDTRIPKPKYRIVKIGLNAILKPHTQLGNRILEATLDLHKLAVHAYQFIALYLTSLLESGQLLPSIDKKFLRDLIRIVLKASQLSNKNLKPAKIRKTNPPQNATAEQIAKKKASNTLRFANRELLTKFMNLHYRPLMSKTQSIKSAGLGQNINWLATEIITALENNIKAHYEDYLYRFCKAVYAPSKTTKMDLATACSTARRMVLKCQHNFSSDDPLLKHLHRIAPQRDISKNSIPYDLEVDPQSYLPCMYYMNAFLEKNEWKSFSLFPMRTSIMPNSIRMDTDVLRQSRYLTPQDKSALSRALSRPWRQVSKGSLTDAERQTIWSHFFQTNLHCFSMNPQPNDRKKKTCHYRFNFSIVTDGVSCSISQTIPDDDPIFKPTISTPSYGKYIHHEEDLESLQGMRVVGCDPGKQDLLYFASPNGYQVQPNKKREKLKTADRFRYSQAQRKFECKTKFFNSIRENEKQREPRIDGKPVAEWEHSLSFVSKKSTVVLKLKEYILQKNLVNSKLFAFWGKVQFRKLKWQAKRLKQISEEKMMKNFRAKFGPPETTLIALGNWSQFKPRKGTEPTKNKSFRVLFRRHGYKTYLVDEFRTSKCCYNCGNEVMQKFLDVPNPKLRRSRSDPEMEKPVCTCDGCKTRPAREKRLPRQVIKCHGLTYCPNCENNGTHWNRDLNGALNIGRIARSLIGGEEYPAYLRREVSNGGANPETAEESEQSPEEEEEVLRFIQKDLSNLEQANDRGFSES